jgi:signal peptidase II
MTDWRTIPLANSLPVRADLTRLRQAPLPPALVRLSRIALLVAVADLLSKALASSLWSERALHLTNWLSLAVVQNYGGAFGMSAGAYTWQLNLALTLAAIVFVVPVTKDLTRVDPEAPVALGLIVGGALGNLVSLLAPPAGVGDFIAIHWSPTHGLVLNFADIAAYAGLAMILRTGFRIASELVYQVRRGPERVGSAYQQKADAKRRVRRIQMERLPEVVVADWDNVADLGVVRADAPETVVPWDEPRVTKVRRGTVLPREEIAAPRLTEQRASRDD